MKKRMFRDSYLEYSNVDQDFDIGIVFPVIEVFFFKINVDVETGKVKKWQKEMTSIRFWLSDQVQS